MKDMFSQYNEEQIITEFFGNYVGTFLDVGAYDGISDSNTHALSLKGWKGVYIEPNLKTFVTLEKNKGNDHICLHGSCDRSEGIKKLLLSEVPQQSTLCTQTTEIPHVSDLFNGFEYVSAWTINQLNGTFGNFDFISIDAEGLDYDVLCGSVHALLYCKLICVEKGMPARRDDEAEFMDQTGRINELMARIGWIALAETQGNLFFKSPVYKVQDQEAPNTLDQ